MYFDVSGYQPPYSFTDETAAWLAENLESDDAILVIDEYNTAAIGGYLNRPIYGLLPGKHREVNIIGGGSVFTCPRKWR